MSCMPCPSLGKKCATTPNKLKNPLRLSTPLVCSLVCSLIFNFVPSASNFIWLLRSPYSNLKTEKRA